jgi:hypothetical protein
MVHSAIVFDGAARRDERQLAAATRDLWDGRDRIGHRAGEVRPELVP